MEQSIILFSDGSRGIYIPKYFAESVTRKYVYGITEEDLNWFLDKEPDHDQYWDRWDEILNNCYLMDHDNNKYDLYQDGDLWLYCEALMTEDEKTNFFGMDY